jgi:predicted amidophosphoribosyltransferase
MSKPEQCPYCLAPASYLEPMGLFWFCAVCARQFQVETKTDGAACQGKGSVVPGNASACLGADGDDG